MVGASRRRGRRRCPNASLNSFVEGWTPSTTVWRVRSASAPCSANASTSICFAPARASSVDAVAQALRAGVEAQLLTADRSERTAFEFRHALTREAILDELLPFERVEIARSALAALELVGSHLGDSFGEQAAALAEEAGETRRAAELLLEASRRARKRGALSSAVPMLERAWSFVGEADPEWFEIGDALVSVLATTGAVDEALETGERMRVAASAGSSVRPSTSRWRRRRPRGVAGTPPARTWRRRTVSSTT